MESIVIAIVFGIVLVAQSVVFYFVFKLKIVAERAESLGELVNAINQPQSEAIAIDENVIPLEQMSEEDL
jgi:uncharacterized membrane protein